ncbi:unnamed protein product [Fusarium graminearum]|uniref:Uncharacterized protein n=1 Tax=Gibberella zeae (strain ATCC MYA-4620 / CBS 123657 / FGSC 9075 / NRRL 31084 / PH-1) TaxID=229533 RepID=A0A098DXH2_GIBZE|nr:unnamed protein product [Fusarium graminearum]
MVGYCKAMREEGVVCERDKDMYSNTKTTLRLGQYPVAEKMYWAAGSDLDRVTPHCYITDP